MELTDRSLLESVFFYPRLARLDNEDFRRFAQGRRGAFTYGGEYCDAPVLRLSGGPDVGDGFKMHNFGFYAPFLYLDAATQRATHASAARHAPAAPLRRARGARDCGARNVQCRPRAPRRLQADVRAHDARCAGRARPSRCSITTSRAATAWSSSPTSATIRSSAEIVHAYPDAVFLDHFILDELGAEFRDLPHHDAIALAFLCQLIAARARDFVGTMTSTFTSLIQRWRGSSGLDERFKFLWNELPAPVAELVRGADGDQRRRPDAPRRHDGRGVRGPLLLEPLTIPPQLRLDARVAGELPAVGRVHRIPKRGCGRVSGRTAPGPSRRGSCAPRRSPA